MKLCNDVLNIIANYLPLRDAIKMSNLKKNFMDLHMEHYTFDKYNGSFIMKHANYLKRIEIENNRKLIKMFVDSNSFSQKIKYLNLDNKNMTDKYLGRFKSIYIHTLRVCYGDYITNKGLKHLKDIHTLCLNSNRSITDEGLKYLKNIHTLCLRGNKNITDEGLKHLKGIHTLDLSSNNNITDEGLEYLKGIHTLNLYHNKNITDRGLEYLEGIYELHLHHNKNITDEKLKHLNVTLNNYNF